MNSDKRIIEINGVKMEVDLRNATVVENLKVGDTVKVLLKSYSGYKSSPGVIVGFDQFKNLPTIIVAYMDLEYSNAELKFCYFNADTKDTEIVKSNPKDIPLKREHVLDYLDKSIIKAEMAVQEAKQKKKYFEDHFNLYFKDFIGDEKVEEVVEVGLTPSADDVPF